MKHAIGLCLALVIVTPVVLFVALDVPKPALASAEALGDIPAELLGIYQQAAHDTCNMAWEVLGAIGKIETDHGRSDLPGVTSGENAAGAGGPMQFLASTWAAYGVDGNGDGVTDRYNPTDAIWGAANYLCANGAGEGTDEGLRNAIWHYNHSDLYVAAVLAQAERYRAIGTATGDVTGLLASPNLILSPRARGDLEAGIIDQRVIDYLGWATRSHVVSVSVLKTGHAKHVAGTDRVSDHFLGRGLDIAAVDGFAYRADCEPCRALVEETLALGTGRPDQIGQPWSDLVGNPGVFSDADHQDHLHAGWGARP